ncbi:MAG TPA: hypothetical protein PKH10_10875 [bacterium]|nr:hypothetical protein [bacterium]
MSQQREFLSRLIERFDALGIVQMQGDTLDRDYLRRWATEIGVGDLLGKLLAIGADI